MPMKPVRSVERAIRILSAVAQSDEPLGLSEISQRTEVDKATALRLLATLESRQLVQRDPVSRRYAAGVGLWQMLTSWRRDLCSVSRPQLEALRRATDETVTLVCPRGMERVVVESLAAPHELCVVPVVGSAQPIYAGASGKVIMAWMPAHDRDRIIELTDLKPVTGGSFSDRASFIDELAAVRARGYAYAVGTVTVGAAALATPVFDASGHVTAALSVRGPETRLSRARIEQIAPFVMEAAREISRQLGYTGDEPGGSAAGSPAAAAGGA
ncbi:MAG: IclR family transcriptional regulator [Halofilum sp. (in: g-proteobacteria)]|nr:IclR family transcriptional regulator [Halofilum sp. (in: g-proteobacteria)]